MGFLKGRGEGWPSLSVSLCACNEKIKLGDFLLLGTAAAGTIARVTQSLWHFFLGGGGSALISTG